MGFFDAIKKVGGAINDMNSETKLFKDKYANLSKEELTEKFQNSFSMAEKSAIAQIMKEKGYR